MIFSSNRDYLLFINHCFFYYEIWNLFCIHWININPDSVFISSEPGKLPFGITPWISLYELYRCIKIILPFKIWNYLSVTYSLHRLAAFIKSVIQQTSDFINKAALYHMIDSWIYDFIELWSFSIKNIHPYIIHAVFFHVWKLPEFPIVFNDFNCSYHSFYILFFYFCFRVVFQKNIIEFLCSFFFIVFPKLISEFRICSDFVLIHIVHYGVDVQTCSTSYYRYIWSAWYFLYGCFGHVIKIFYAKLIIRLDYIY